MPVGLLVMSTLKEVLKRIFRSPEPTISETEIASVVRQYVIGNATTVITASTSPADEKDTVVQITHRCLDLLSHMDDLEVTFSIAADGSRSVTIRKATNIATDDLILNAEDTYNRLNQPVPAILSTGQGHEHLSQYKKEIGQESNVEILARIRERVNRPEEDHY
jgi:hypothetical protein